MSKSYLDWRSNETPGRRWVDTGIIEENIAPQADSAVGVTMNPLLLARALVALQPGTQKAVASGGLLRRPVRSARCRSSGAWR